MLQEGAQRPTRPQALSGSDGQVNRRVSILILYVQLVLAQPAEQIDECNLGGLEASPVQRRRSSLVFRHEAHALLLEEEEADWFVALCRNMHHIETVEVLRKHISTSVEQLVAHVDVAAEGRVVQRRELVLVRLQVDPSCDLLRCHLLLRALHDCLESAHLVLKYRHVNETEAILVN